MDPLPHVAKRITFTESIMSHPNNLAEAMRMAGYQAKEYGRGDGPFR